MDLVQRISAEIDARREELRPLVDEERRLRDVLAALDGLENASGPRTESRRPSGREREARGRTGSRGRRRLPTAEREAQILEIVAARPMISSADLAQAIGVTRNRLYQLTTSLVEQGRLERADGAFILAARPVEAADAARDAGSEDPAEPSPEATNPGEPTNSR